ncbi:unnamed protein product, partial [Protopolystoma xenopodis]
MPAEPFILISSADLRRHDSLMYPAETTNNKDVNNPLASLLHLPRLPRSSPLAGTALMLGIGISLESRVVARGFL